MNDLISRQAALDALDWKWAGKAAIDAIKNLPPVLTIDPVKHGRWENGRCNKCGFQTRVHPYHIDTNTFERTLVFKYCPNCGAKMDGGEG